MQDLEARVLSVREHPLPYFSLSLQVPPAFGAAAAGQFLMVLVGERLEPYLRRPFSIHDLRQRRDGSEIEILGKIVGRGTRLLAASRVGDSLKVLGPLGRGFDSSPKRRVAVVAGGVGSAALLLLCRDLVAAGSRVDLYYGGRSRIDLPRLPEFGQVVEASGGSLVVTTEDGSAGEAGMVTAPLERALAEGRYDFLYACGPMGLLRALADVCRQYSIAGEAAVETPMGCGYGACLGCVVPRVDGRYALCCKDGPVFRFSEVAW